MEDVSEKIIAITINESKVTANNLIAVLEKFLQRETSKDVKHGKQKLSELLKGKQAVNNIEISKDTLRSFEKIAKKYNIDYAVQSAPYASPPKTLIFFRGNNVDVMEHCFKEFVHKEKQKSERQKESIKVRIEKNKEICKSLNKDAKAKNKELVR